MTRAALLALVSHWRRHPGQLATLLLGLALATALWSAVQAINAEARASYDRAASVFGQDRLTRLEAADGRAIPLRTYVEMRRAGLLVSPVIEGRLRGSGEGADLRLVGVDPLTAPADAMIAGMDGARIVPGGVTGGDGVVFLSAETLARGVPDTLPADRRVAALPPGLALTDIATAAALLGRSDPSHLILDPDQPLGAPGPDAFPQVVAVAPETGDDLARLTDSFHLNLTAFGLLAFAVGLFIVHGTIGLAFEQRRPVLRTLRALGLPLGRLMGLMFAELIAVAVLAGAAGIALGYMIAAALLPGVAGTLRGLYGAAVTDSLSFEPAWAAAAMAISVLGACMAAAHALWQAARLPLLATAQPRAWARASGRTARGQAALSVLLLASAAGFAAFGGSLVAGFACLAALLVGAALALPGALTLILRLAGGRLRSPFGEWLLADTRQQLPGLSLALMALLLALAANIGVSTMVGSFRHTFLGWLDQRLASELYVTARTEAEAAEIRAFLGPRSDALLPIVSVEARPMGAPGRIFGVIDHATYRDHWPLLRAVPQGWDRLAAGDGALINEQLALRHDLDPGDTVDLAPGWRLPVLGVYSDYGNPLGQAIVGHDLLAARHPDLSRLRMAVRVPPAQAAALAGELRARFDLPDRNLVDQAQVKAASVAVFEQTFRVTGALNLLTLGVAGFALLTSLLTLAGMRLPQLAPVWALGQSRRTLALAELGRALLLALLTWALAIPVGLALAWGLLAVVNVEAFGWRLPMRLFPGSWLGLGLAALLAAAVSAAWPALRLARTPPSQLLKVFAHER